MGFWKKLIEAIFGGGIQEQRIEFINERMQNVAISTRGKLHAVMWIDGKLYYRCIQATGPCSNVQSYGTPTCRHCLDIMRKQPRI